MGGERGAMPLPVGLELAPFMVNSIDGPEVVRGKLSGSVCSGGESMVVLGSKGFLFSMLTIRLMLGRKGCGVVELYVGEVVNGRMSECAVDGKESSKEVEGCRPLEVVLSSISRLYAPPPDVSG